MINKFLSRFIFIEILVITVLLFLLLINTTKGVILTDLIINLIFISTLILVFIFRNSHQRHFYFAFIFILITALAEVFLITPLVYIAGSLVLCFLFIGVLNMILFSK